MTRLFKSDEVEFKCLNENGIYILYMNTLTDVRNINYDKIGEISSVFTTILETYNNQNIKYGILYDIRRTDGIPSKRLLDYWTRFFNEHHDTMFNNQVISVILINNNELINVLNGLVKIFQPVGQVKFLSNYDEGFNIITECLRKIKVPKKIKSRLKNMF